MHIASFGTDLAQLRGNRVTTGSEGNCVAARVLGIGLARAESLVRILEVRFTLLRAKPSKDGDAESRGYGGSLRYARRAASERPWRPLFLGVAHSAPNGGAESSNLYDIRATTLGVLGKRLARHTTLCPPSHRVASPGSHTRHGVRAACRCRWPNRTSTPPRTAGDAGRVLRGAERVTEWRWQRNPSVGSGHGIRGARRRPPGGHSLAARGDL